MRATARVVAEAVAGRTALRVVESAAPLSLVPRRGAGPTTVHVVNSAAAPLGGDHLTLRVEVGPGAELHLAGVAAAVVLPGHRGEPSLAEVDVEVGDGGSLVYLPEPTVVTARADHTASLRARLGGGARLHLRDTVVLGRSGERPGRLATDWHVTAATGPVLRQRLVLGDADLDATAPHLGGHRVLATELWVGHGDPEPAGGPWWSLVPLGHRAALATALAADAVTAGRHLAEAAAALTASRP